MEENTSDTVARPSRLEGGEIARVVNAPDGGLNVEVFDPKSRTWSVTSDIFPAEVEMGFSSTLLTPEEIKLLGA